MPDPSSTPSKGDTGPQALNPAGAIGNQAVPVAPLDLSKAALTQRPVGPTEACPLECINFEQQIRPRFEELTRSCKLMGRIDSCATLGQFVGVVALATSLVAIDGPIFAKTALFAGAIFGLSVIHAEVTQMKIFAMRKHFKFSACFSEYKIISDDSRLTVAPLISALSESTTAALARDEAALESALLGLRGITVPDYLEARVLAALRIFPAELRQSIREEDSQERINKLNDTLNILRELLEKKQAEAMRPIYQRRQELAQEMLAYPLEITARYLWRNRNEKIALIKTDQNLT